jgi:hypothetical protein
MGNDHGELPDDENTEIGELRLVDGNPSMFIGYRSYGGGEGGGWATVNEWVEFTVKKVRGGYMRGWCREVNAIKKSVSLEIVDGMTWGKFESGKLVEVLAEEIGRYHSAYPDMDMLEISKNQQMDTYKRQRFAGISERELDQLFEHESRQLLVELMGEDEVQRVEEISRNFNIVLNAIKESNGWEARQPRRATSQAVRKIHDALAIRNTGSASKNST